MFYFADSDDAADSVVGGEDRGAAFCAGQAPCRADGGGKGISERGAGGSGPRRGGGEARADGVAGELTIGFIRGYEQSRFSETLRSFHEAYPNISIHLLRENMSALYELLDNGTCDLAFNLSLYTQNYEDLKHRFLKRFPMMAVLYPGHTLAGESHLMYRDLAREDFIIMQPQGRSNDEAEEVLICYNKGGFIPNIVAREREVQTVLLEVSAGFGVAILPEYAVRHYRNARNLVVVPLLRADGSPEELDFEIAWRQSNPNPAIEKLLQWVETHEYVE